MSRKKLCRWGNHRFESDSRLWISRYVDKHLRQRRFQQFSNILSGRKTELAGQCQAGSLGIAIGNTDNFNSRFFVQELKERRTSVAGANNRNPKHLCPLPSRSLAH